MVGLRCGRHGRQPSSRIEPRLAPRHAGPLATELDALVQTKWAVLPELDADWNNSKAGPVRRSWHRADRELGGVERDCLLEGEPALQRRRLLAGPGADLRQPRPGGVVGVGLGFGNPLDRAAQTHLAV